MDNFELNFAKLSINNCKFCLKELNNYNFNNKQLCDKCNLFFAYIKSNHFINCSCIYCN